MTIASIFRRSAAPKAAPDKGVLVLDDTEAPSLELATPQDGDLQNLPVCPTRVIDRRFLFAGGTTAWFRQVEREMFGLHPTWLAQHAPDCAQTLAALNALSFDGLLVDTTLAGARSVLEVVETDFPCLIRFVLCEAALDAELEALNRPGVRLLQRSLELPDLMEALNTSLQVRDWMADPVLAKLLSRIERLPTLPRIHTQVTAELQSPNGSLEVVSNFVRQDPVMSAKFLHVVNSALFARAYPVTDPGEAVMFLGTEQTRSLILSAGVFSQFDAVRCPGFSPEQIWRHSLRVASLARGIALVETEDPRMAELAYTAGLLHDLGKLVLAANVPAMCATVLQLQKNKNLPLHEAELAVFGATHGQLGACLLGAWSLPLPLLEAVAWHHCPARSSEKTFSVLTAVHVANVLAHETGPSGGPDGSPAWMDAPYLTKAGLNHRVKVWREACGVPGRG